MSMRSLEELKIEIRNRTSTDDLVSAIIHKSSQTKIPKAEAFLQQSFYKLKIDFPDLFEDFVFDNSGIIPFSDSLDSTLFRLESSSILSTLNPSYSNYTVTTSPEALKASYDKYNEIDLDTIDQCASEFSRLVTTQAF